MSKSATKTKQKREPVHQTLFLSDQIQLTEISKPKIKKIIERIETKSSKQSSKPIKNYDRIVKTLEKLHIEETSKQNGNLKGL